MRMLRRLSVERLCAVWKALRVKKRMVLKSAESLQRPLEVWNLQQGLAPTTDEFYCGAELANQVGDHSNVGGAS